MDVADISALAAAAGAPACGPRAVVRRRALPWLGLLAVVGIATGGCGPRESAPVRPDVVLVTWDTARADHVGPDAAVPGLTPHWTRMASEGVRFHWARTPSPMTLPAHASLLTGRGPSLHGARTNTLFSLAEGERTLAERLAGAGWATGAFVSAAVLDARFGLDQGFDTYDDRTAGSGERGFAERRADETVDAALDWIAAVPEARPLFLWLHLFDPHQPWDAPAEWAAAHPGDPYRAEIAFADHQTGRLLEGLAAAGRLDRTLLVMTADHGEGLGEHGEPTHGYFLYDSTMRVPLLFRAGDRVGADLSRGLRVDAPVLLSDVAPTLLDLLGLEPGTGDGLSLRPLLRGEGAPARELALESVNPYYIYGAAPAFGVVDTRGQVWIDLPRRERYAVESDPDQLRNLYASADADEVDALFARHPRSWPPPRTEALLDEARADQLAALGYVGARTASAADPGESVRPDPKDLLPVAQLWMRRHGDARPDEALAEAEALARRFGPLPALAFFRADRLRELGRRDGAIAVLREALVAHPAETRLRDEVETLQRERAKDRALARRIRDVLERHPEHPAAVHDLAVVLHRLGERDEAERLYRRWIEAHPDDDTTRLDLHRLLAGRGDLDEALAVLRAAPSGPGRSTRLACAEGRLLSRWLERPRAAAPLLRACPNGDGDGGA